jgi:hypothetical protein
MIVKRLSIAGALAALAFGAAGVANAAPVTIAGATYDEEDAADDVTVWSGQVGYYNLAGGPMSVDEAIGGSASDGVYCVNGACSFLVGFEGGVENQEGADIAIYGLGTGNPEYFDLAYNGVRLSDLTLTATGSYVGRYQLSVLFFDLSDFGVAIGQTVNAFKVIVNAGNDSEEFAAFFSLNSDEDVLVNPIPAAAWLFGSALLGGGFVARKRKRS